MLKDGAFNARSAVQWFGPKYPDLDFRALAAERRASLAPADRHWLKDRLVRMSMSDGHERDGARVAIWLAETGRLLMQEPTIPGDILDFAIDEAIKRSDRGFMPKVGQIRAIADPMLAQRERETVRLEAMAKLLGGPAQPKAEEPPLDWYTPEKAAAIYAEAGFAPSATLKLKVHDGPATRPTPDAHREIAAAMGISMDASDLPPIPDITGMTPTGIFAQRDRNRAAAIAEEWCAEQGGYHGG